MTLVAKRIFNFAFYSNYNRSFWISFRTSRIKSCFYTQMWHLRKKYQVPTSMLYSHFAFVRFAVDDRWPAVMAGTINVRRENVWSGDKIHCFREIYFYLHFYHPKGDPLPASTVLIHWAEVCLQKKDHIYTNTGPYRQYQTSCQGNQWFMVYWFGVIFPFLTCSSSSFLWNWVSLRSSKWFLRYSVVFFSSKRPFLFQFHV